MTYGAKSGKKAQAKEKNNQGITKKPTLKKRDTEKIAKTLMKKNID